MGSFNFFTKIIMKQRINCLLRSNRNRQVVKLRPITAPRLREIRNIFWLKSPFHINSGIPVPRFSLITFSTFRIIPERMPDPWNPQISNSYPWYARILWWILVCTPTKASEPVPFSMGISFILQMKCGMIQIIFPELFPFRFISSFIRKGWRKFKKVLPCLKSILCLIIQSF